MNIYYFVGGPIEGMAEEFFRRLEQAGGTPAAWSVYRHTARDGKALHVIRAESLQEITDHLGRFSDVYEHSEIVEIQEITR